nr:MAG TPA: hypothetical protein [Caudoviricetes sp.]
MYLILFKIRYILYICTSAYPSMCFCTLTR